MAIASRRLPEGFHMTAQTDEGVNAFENPERNIYGVQFHPEVAHTPLGAQILRNFCLRFVAAKATGRRPR
jgi:GMP synthase (glutamine-hydrolysing)